MSHIQYLHLNQLEVRHDPDLLSHVYSECLLNSSYMCIQANHHMLYLSVKIDVPKTFKNIFVSHTKLKNG